MTLAANDTARQLVRESPPSHLVVELRGRGPGGVVVSRGVLTADSQAECQTNTGQITLSFAADDRGAAFEYSAYSEHGLEIPTPASAASR